MAQYKSEFLAQKYKGRLHPLHHYVFGFADMMARLGSLTPGLTNFLLSAPMTSPLIKHMVGVAQERRMPQLARKSWKAGRAADETANVPRGAKLLVRPTNGVEASHSCAGKKAQGWGTEHEYLPAGSIGGEVVVLWADTWNNYYHPQTLASAERVLTQAGFRVQTTRGHICCGRALYDFGLLDTARGYMARVLDAIAPQIEAGLPFIFLEPSCASIFKDEALELFPNDERAQKMSKLVWLLADWLAAKAPDWVDGRLKGAQVILHGHCHHKAVFGGPKSEIALLRKAGAHVETIETTCCGMAGPFGFEADKIEVSKAIANLGLLPAVKAAGPMTLIVADGFSCREQIAQLSDREGLHFAEILDRSCGCGG
jgi:hypothetical protein